MYIACMSCEGNSSFSFNCSLYARASTQDLTQEPHRNQIKVGGAFKIVVLCVYVLQANENTL